MSAWQVIALVPVANSRKEQLEQVHRQLNHELQKPKNAAFMVIYDDMWQEVANQLIERHFLMTALIEFIDLCIERTRKVRSSVKSFLRARERSSLESVLLEEPNRHDALQNLRIPTHTLPTANMAN